VIAGTLLRGDQAGMLKASRLAVFRYTNALVWNNNSFCKFHEGRPTSLKQDSSAAYSLIPPRISENTRAVMRNLFQYINSSTNLLSSKKVCWVLSADFFFDF